MKTATMTLPKPKIHPDCQFSSAYANCALEQLERVMTNFLTALANSTTEYPRWDLETFGAYQKLRGALEMAKYCDLIDWSSGSEIIDAAIDLLYGIQRKAADAT